VNPVLTNQKTEGRSLVSAALFARLVDRIVAEVGLDHARATRVMDQALAFLATCAKSTTCLAPSKQVDRGWHAFILHTREYAAFCERVAGRFIHHDPADETGNAEGQGDAAPTATATATAIRAAGYTVDDEMWDSAAACGETGCGAGRPPLAPA
jgi:hypothetical protein